MHFSAVSLASPLAALISCVSASTQGCTGGSNEENGNFYCGAVSAITYEDVGAPGSYNEVTGMDANGHCSSKPHPFSGPMAPLNEEVSLRILIDELLIVPSCLLSTVVYPLPRASEAQAVRCLLSTE
jgi:hypothetical protein